MESSHYKSIRARIRGWARCIDSLSATPFFQNMEIQGRGGIDLSESKLPDPLVDYLIRLDYKLDTILGLLATEDLTQDFPLSLNTVEVSGDHLVFTMNERVPTGQHLEIVLLLSRMPVIMASAMGQVHPGNDQEFGQVYGMDLSRIREEDRDAVIRFVFQQERRSLRAGWE